MIERSGSRVSQLDGGSRFPFHNSWRRRARRKVRPMIRHITSRRERSIHTTMSARAHTRSRTAV